MEGVATLPSGVFAASSDLVSMCAVEVPSCRLQVLPSCVTGCWSTSLTFPMVAIAVGCALHVFVSNYAISYHLIQLGFGIALGGIGCSFNLGRLSQSLQQWVHIDPPDLFFGIFLVPLIFSTAITTDWHAFIRLAPLIFVTAFIVPISTTGLIALFVRLTVGWTSWWAAAMFGAMNSITEPIAITSTLKSLGVSVNLAGLIEGESLFNDATTVFWAAFLYNVEHRNDPKSIGEIWKQVTLTLGAGLGIGVAFAVVAVLVISFVHGEPEMEISLTIAVAYLGFWTAQTVAKASGVISNVTSGIFIAAFGHRHISPCSREHLYKFWVFLAWMANTIVFVYAGLLSVVFVWPCSTRPKGSSEYILIFFFFLYLQIIRLVQFALFHVPMNVRTTWFTLRESLVLGLSGTRGAVSLVLALHVAKSKNVPEEMRSVVLLWTTCSVLLSLIINPVMVRKVLDWLKMDMVCSTRQQFLENARTFLIHCSLENLDQLCVDASYRRARWSYVLENVLPRKWLDTARTESCLLAAPDVVPPDSSMSSDVRCMHNPTIFSPGAHFADDPCTATTVPVQFSIQKPHSQVPANYSMCSSLPLSALRSAVHLGNINRIRPFQQVLDGICPEPVRRVVDMPVYQLCSVEFVMQAYQIGQNLCNQEEHMPSDLQISDSTSFPGISNLHDIAMRRRVLCFVASRLRGMTNTTVMEFRALVWLEDHLQRALHAFDQKKEYDLFSEMKKSGMCSQIIPSCSGFQKFSGKHIFAISVVVYILTDTLQHDVLQQQSPRVFAETERLCEAFHKWLVELEEALPDELEWTHSQLAIHIIRDRQDKALLSRRESGIITIFEYDKLLEQLLVVRRRQNLFTSIFWNWKKAISSDRLSFHPLISHIPPAKVHILLRRARKRHPGRELPMHSFAVQLLMTGYVRPQHGEVPHVEDIIRRRRAWPSSSPFKYGEMGSRTAFEDTHGNELSRPYWCLSAPAVVCSPFLECSFEKIKSAGHCKEGREDIPLSEWASCAQAKVVGMTEAEVRENTRECQFFQNELARTLVHELVLRLCCWHSADQGSLGALDLLQRLPYMTVTNVYGGSHSPIRIRGPCVLISGTVRVSSPENMKELHSNLKGPAFISAREVIIGKVQDALECFVSFPSEQNDERPVVGTILVQHVSMAGRLQRWAAHPSTVDTNGRFVMFRHTLRPLQFSEISRVTGQ